MSEQSLRTGRAKSDGRVRWGDAQVVVLRGFIATEVVPLRPQRDFLAMLLGTSSRRIQVWFQNHRVGHAQPLFAAPYGAISSVARDQTLSGQLEAMAQHGQRFELLLSTRYDLMEEVGDALFDELSAAVTLCDGGRLDEALSRLTALLGAFASSIDLPQLKTRQDRRHWFAVMLTCVCECVKYWARHLLAVAHAHSLALLCHAFDAVAGLSDFVTRAGLLEVTRSVLGTLAAAFVVADATLVVSNDIVDAADLLMRQSAAVLSQQHLLMAVAGMLPSAHAQGRVAACGSQHRLTKDGVMAASSAALVSAVGGALPPPLPPPSSAEHKRDRAAFDGRGAAAAVTDDFELAFLEQASLVDDDAAWAQRVHDRQL